MKDKKKIDLFWLLEATADDIQDEPDGAYWQILRDAILRYNDDYKTNFDEYDLVHEWVDWKNKEAPNDN